MTDSDIIAAAELRVYNCSSRASRDVATGTFDRDDVSLTIERSETSHRATSGGGSKLAPSFDVSQFEKVFPVFN